MFLLSNTKKKKTKKMCIFHISSTSATSVTGWAVFFLYFVYEANTSLQTNRLVSAYVSWFIYRVISVNYWHSVYVRVHLLPSEWWFTLCESSNPMTYGSEWIFLGSIYWLECMYFGTDCSKGNKLMGALEPFSTH